MREIVDRIVSVAIGLFFAAVPVAAERTFTTVSASVAVFGIWLLFTLAVGVWGEIEWPWLRKPLRFLGRILGAAGAATEAALAFLGTILAWAFMATLYSASFLLAGTGVLALVRQSFHWLETGRWPEMDLLWLISDRSCLGHTEHLSTLTARDYCRPRSVFTTEWVGANEMANWFLDAHLAIVALPLCAVLASWAMAILDGLSRRR